MVQEVQGRWRVRVVNRIFDDENFLIAWLIKGKV